jgi:GPH family glycoside/pentoside/hexuronide:cation symporter
MSMLGKGALAAYGVTGLPLALASLPLYVHLPQFYAAEMGVPLGLAGAVLLTMRLLAACADPLIGLAIDRTGQRFVAAIATGAPFLLAGFAMLFMPPALRGPAAAAWMALGLVVAYVGFGLMSIAHQGWGAALSDRVTVRAHLPAVREAFGLAGVVLAAVIAGTLGYGWMTALLAAALAASLAAITSAPSLRTVAGTPAPDERSGLGVVFRNQAFRRLFAVLLVNGTASAIPATLFLFFAADVLALAQLAPVFLVAYFVAAVCSLPAWTRMAARIGEARAWMAGMAGSVLVFAWTALLDAGSAAGFMAVCLASGAMLGADLALPSALLAGVIARAGHANRHEAAYFGAWNWGVQLTLALAAGTALPLLGWAGYEPGGTAGKGALLAAYCLLPCLLKLAAAAMLFLTPPHHHERSLPC